MRLACIDIGTNTTRLLVAEPDEAGLCEITAARVFAGLGHVRASRAIGPAAIAAIVRATAAHVEAARLAGAEGIEVVATAGVRAADDREELRRAVSAVTGLPVRLLSEDEEGCLAFLGATHGLTDDPQAALGVIDVGGGSTELVAGTRAGGVTWIASLAIGSAVLTEEYLTSDPPDPAELAAAADHADAEFADLGAPVVAAAYAVGGSATSLFRLVGPVLDADSLTLVRERVTSAPSATLAQRLELDPRRTRLLPAGIMLLERAVRVMGMPARIAAGGVREGVILERLATSARPS
jgi:exopolyphosphatase / guanosine-5'-triphosphate,3'-diphosphate pyrophosphatase